MNPTKFRPQKPDYEFADQIEDDEEDWEDNAVSNTMAWASQKFVPSWCSYHDHWSVRLMDYFYTDCPCCLFIRGAVFGGFVAFTIVAIIGGAWAAFLG